MQSVPSIHCLCALWLIALVTIGCGKKKPTVDTVPGRLTSGSMAPRLRGPHLCLTCKRCDFPFSCDAQQLPHDRRAVCPNCGWDKNPLDPSTVVAGDRVSIVPLSNTSIERWDLVAFRHPEDQQPTIKRLVGMPGELVSIRRGEIFVDGEPIRKTLDQQRKLAVLVHDAAFRIPAAPLEWRRWSPASPESGWEENASGYVFERQVFGDQPGDDRRGWLKYTHRRCLPTQHQPSEVWPVEDNYGYNQAVARKLRPVEDLMIEMRVELSGSGGFTLRLHNGFDWYQVELLLPSRAIKVQRGSEWVGRAQMPLETLQQPLELVFSLFDRQICLAVNGQQLVCESIPTSDPAVKFLPTPQPVELGARGLSVHVSALRLWRDIYYLGPGRSDVPWTMNHRLGKDEYFVVGDNVPVSLDSRQWPAGSVNRNSLLGKVLEDRSTTKLERSH